MLTEQQWLEIFADNLRSLMNESNMSQRELSRISGVSEAAISKYLNAKCMPSVNALANIAYAFPCASLEDFLVFSDDRIELRPSRRW